ncbi:hypothetical protein SAMN05421747_11945 [Parapedobacter composti]|uniref:Uncharacterized protein n=1 Tax=Parapedobacter composti TaxID=623281 RepID=A0A1I1LH34_9SPHI|nr:hypothetical protein SAMN05421747_11945 [Parapedobacter composti]
MVYSLYPNASSILECLFGFISTIYRSSACTYSTCNASMVKKRRKSLPTMRVVPGRTTVLTCIAGIAEHPCYGYFQYG